MALFKSLVIIYFIGFTFAVGMWSAVFTIELIKEAFGSKNNNRRSK